jgi:lysozyme family protein
MSDLFDRLDAPTAAVEGGHVNNPDDRGGETNHGITLETARANGFSGQMRDMTAAQAKAIRKAKYFVKPGIYHIAPLSERIATEVYDSGILHGTGTAAIWLQRALNALNRRGKDYADIDVDGGIGPATAAALKAYLKRNGRLAELRLLKALNVLQGAFCVTISEAREANETFLAGWLDNRVNLPGDLA